MSSILFRGAVIRYADLRPETEGGILCRLHLQADLSQPVSDSMEWESIPECCSTAKLTGRLTGRNLVLTRLALAPWSAEWMDRRAMLARAESDALHAAQDQYRTTIDEWKRESETQEVEG